ncbi:MAG: hypothetical protein IKN17_03215 [Ruminococcus sp.]|nr:hypothetical protein [Ruminococcus sp.]
MTRVLKNKFKKAVAGLCTVMMIAGAGLLQPAADLFGTAPAVYAETDEQYSACYYVRRTAELADAIKEIREGSQKTHIVLLQDITVSSSDSFIRDNKATENIYFDNEMILDLNGHTLTFNRDNPWFVCKTEEGTGGHLTIKNGYLVNYSDTDDAEKTRSLFCVYDATLIFENVSIVTDRGDLVRDFVRMNFDPTYYKDSNIVIRSGRFKSDHISRDEDFYNPFHSVRDDINEEYPYDGLYTYDDGSGNLNPVHNFSELYWGRDLPAPDKCIDIVSGSESDILNGKWWYCGDFKTTVDADNTIKAALPQASAPTAAEGLVYTGKPQELLTAPASPAFAGGSETKIYYYLTDGKMTSVRNAPADYWKAELPKATNAGSYKVWYKAAKDGVISDAKCVSVQIAKAEITDYNAPAIKRYVRKDPNGDTKLVQSKGSCSIGSIYFREGGELFMCDSSADTEYDISKLKAGDQYIPAINSGKSVILRANHVTVQGDLEGTKEYNGDVTLISYTKGTDPMVYLEVNGDVYNADAFKVISADPKSRKLVIATAFSSDIWDKSYSGPTVSSTGDYTVWTKIASGNSNYKDLYLGPDTVTVVDELYGFFSIPENVVVVDSLEADAKLIKSEGSGTYRIDSDCTVYVLSDDELRFSKDPGGVLLSASGEDHTYGGKTYRYVTALRTDDVQHCGIYVLDAVYTEYTVTWVDGNGKTLKTDKVRSGSVPAYDGAAPTKKDDANYTYTFSGWSDGKKTYGVNEALPEVTGDVKYTAQFTKVNKGANDLSPREATPTVDGLTPSSKNPATGKAVYLLGTTALIAAVLLVVLKKRK